AEGGRGIVNLREPEEHNVEEEATLARHLGLRYVNIPVKTAAPKDEQVEAFLKATNDPKVFPLFIHCASGNRVGAFWMIRRVLVDGWTPERAEEEAKRIGLRSPNLLDFARDYIHGHAKEAPDSDTCPSWLRSYASFKRGHRCPSSSSRCPRKPGKGSFSRHLTGRP